MMDARKLAEAPGRQSLWRSQKKDKPLELLLRMDEGRAYQCRDPAADDSAIDDSDRNVDDQMGTGTKSLDAIDMPNDETTGVDPLMQLDCCAHRWTEHRTIPYGFVYADSAMDRKER
ncbi:hypothetical protein IAQ61_001664 [Plenodomus lingam]|nr:hypothetical protein IAQ61_001664 [Plenodomus lingam]